MKTNPKCFWVCPECGTTKESRKAAVECCEQPREVLSQEEVGKMIKAFGGTGQCARAAGISDSAVSIWRRRGIPQIRLENLRLKYPEIFQAIERGESPARIALVRAEVYGFPL